MKQLAAISIFLITLALFFDSTAGAKESYEWKNVVVSGKGCFPPKCAEGQYPMAVLPLVGFDEKLYGIGDKRIWTSDDGIDWTSQPKTDWDERYGMRFAFFKNKLWMLGGMKTWDDFRNDVWSSADGKDWKQVVSKAVWSARRGHGVVVFKDKLWILGGSISSGRRDQTPTEFLNDVWSSDDGVNWNLVSANAPWSAREVNTSLVFDDKIWVIGGGARGKYCDVWSSSDGKNWTQVIAKADWGERHGNGGLVFDGKIWIFGGMDLNDVWFSTDGKSWQKAFEHAPWSTRSAYYSVAFKNKIWIFSGKTGRADTQTGDIWAMSRKTE
jgi:hypothetical protein